MRLRRVQVSSPGWTRRRAGRGFVYLDGDGQRLPDDEVARIKALVIPPAWTEVWICPYPNGHVQATGVDAAGRRQYLYHPRWCELRDQEKFERARELGAALVDVRQRVSRDLKEPGMPLERACGLAVRLLDVGAFRIGTDAYTEEHGSFGLTTLTRNHVRRRGSELVFSFTGKSGVEQRIVVEHGAVTEAVEEMRRRRGGFQQLLAYKQGRQWRRVTPEQVNEYLRRVSGLEVSAKDFRTWHATVLAALALAGDGDVPSTRTARERRRREAIAEVAEFLGNTPTVARNSYVDPKVLELFDDGRVVAPVPGRVGSGAWQARAEAEVLRLLRE